GLHALDYQRVPASTRTLTDSSWAALPKRNANLTRRSPSILWLARAGLSASSGLDKNFNRLVVGSLAKA
ncbi:hypothetical protein, partial [Salmonella enterica]|uniref:hypothetical protein n=1 Tax=Salmonella enterica TaxID=28901 RepID=UPI002FCD7B1C